MRSLKSTILIFFEKVRILRILSWEMRVLKLRKLYKRRKSKKKEKLAYMDWFHTVKLVVQDLSQKFSKLLECAALSLS